MKFKFKDIVKIKGDGFYRGLVGVVVNYFANNGYGIQLIGRNFNLEVHVDEQDLTLLKEEEAKQ